MYRDIKVSYIAPVYKKSGEREIYECANCRVISVQSIHGKS